MNSTVTIRECHGETKYYCDWGIPGLNSKMMWPYDVGVITEATKQDLFTGKRYEAKCINANQYFKRT